jgi:hypothetical protein
MAIQIDGDSGVSGVNGSATTPALQGTDSNTGIVFGTDEVQIATGGSTRATVDSSGRLLVGTTSNYAQANADDLVIGDNSSNDESGITLGSDRGSGIRFADSANDSAGLIEYFHTDNSLRLSTDASEQMRLDSSGRLGIGTSSPARPLHVQGTTGDTYARIGNNSGGSHFGVLSGGDTVIETFTSGKNIRFLTSGAAERVRVTSNGELLINRTAAAFNEKFSVQNGANVAFFNCTTNSDVSGILIKHAFAQGSQTATQIDFRNDANSTVGTIKSTASATSYNTSSDYRLKENVVDLDGAIARVKQLLPKRFNFIVNTETTVDGFLAHEAATVVPEAVTGTHNQVQVWDESEELPEGVSVGDNKLDEEGNTIPEYQGIDQSKLVPLLTAALKEAIGKIETLETKVAALEAA